MHREERGWIQNYDKNSHTSNCRHCREDILWYVREVIVVQEETSQSRDAGEHVWSQKCQAIATQVPAMEARQDKLPHKLLTRNIHELDSDSQCTYSHRSHHQLLQHCTHTGKHEAHREVKRLLPSKAFSSMQEIELLLRYL